MQYLDDPFPNQLLHLISLSCGFSLMLLHHRNEWLFYQTLYTASDLQDLWICSLLWIHGRM